MNKKVKMKNGYHTSKATINMMVVAKLAFEIWKPAAPGDNSISKRKTVELLRNAIWNYSLESSNLTWYWISNFIFFKKVINFSRECGT